MESLERRRSELHGPQQSRLLCLRGTLHLGRGRTKIRCSQRRGNAEPQKKNSPFQSSAFSLSSQEIPCQVAIIWAPSPFRAVARRAPPWRRSRLRQLPGRTASEDSVSKDLQGSVED